MHLMIDLETLGLDPICVVTQIGYTVFDEMGCHFSGHLRPQIEEQCNRGRKISPSTFIWWLQQSEEARKSMVVPSEHMMEDCLGQFIGDIELQFGWDNIEGIWSHGSIFDCVIMQDLFFMYGMKNPLDFRKIRDTRTLFSLIPNFKWDTAKVKHDANADAFAQAEAVRKAWGIINSWSDAHEILENDAANNRQF